MSKLIFADIPRVLRSKIFYIVLFITAFMAAASVLVTFADTDNKQMVFLVSSNNLAMFISILMPVFSGGLSIMLISGEFSSGIIRNKFIMGHRRPAVLLSWTVIYSLTTVLTYIVYVGSYLITLKAVGTDLSEFDTGVIAVNFLLIFLFLMKFQMFSLLMVCIYPDAKMSVITYLLNNLTMVPLLMFSINNADNKAVKFLSRIFIYGYIGDGYSLITKPDKPWFSAVCILTLSVIYMVLAGLYFNKKDLK